MKKFYKMNDAVLPNIQIMSGFIAFLRAINVGGHTVKMDVLRQFYESFGFSGAETFIASGNIIFEATPQSPEVMEMEIEARLREALGYEVPLLSARMRNWRRLPSTNLSRQQSWKPPPH